MPPLPPRKPEQDHSPTSATREGSGTIEQETEGKFKAAEAKAKREGVHSLTSEDIEGLSDEQIKQVLITPRPTPVLSRRARCLDAASTVRAR